MRFSMTLVFSILFLIVLVFYLNLDTRSPALEQEPMMQKLMPLNIQDEITSLQIEKLKERETITLARGEKGQWMIQHPITATADPLFVQGLISALRLSPQVRRLSPEQDWEAYGLKTPEIKIGVETKAGKMRRYLDLGNLNNSGEFIFARWEEEKDYFLLSTDIKSAFSQSVYSLRLKSIFQTPLKDISKIHFRIEREEYELSQHQGRWFWMEPILLLGDALDPTQAVKMTNKIQNLSVKEFFDGAQPGSQATGFTSMGNRIEITSVHSEKEVLDLGKEMTGKDSLYAKKPDSPNVFLVSKSNLAGFFKGMEVLTRELVEKERQKSPAKAA